MKHILTIGALGVALLLSIPSMAQEVSAKKEKELVAPEQAAMAMLQQQRNQAATQAADLAASLTYLQAQVARERQYWDDYVKGLYPGATTAPPKK